MSLLGTGLSILSTLKESQAMAAQEKANAEIAEMQAQQVRASGAYEESKLKKEKASTLSTQQARYAKAGVRFEGSPLEVMADTAANYEMDIRTSRYNTAIQAAQYDYESQYRRSMAKTYKQLGYYGAGKILLSAGET